jgi:hypothetical protein
MIVKTLRGVDMSRSRTGRKEKKTFSLSRKALMYLESVRKEKKSQSMSAVLEELIRRQQRAAEMERISTSIRSYYDSLTEEEVDQDRAWGQFAETQLPREK